jgi:hypothetical protein
MEIKFGNMFQFKSHFLSVFEVFTAKSTKTAIYLGVTSCIKVKCADVSDDNTGSIFKIEYPSIFYSEGERGIVVVRALCYNPEGRGFDSR